MKGSENNKDSREAMTASEKFRGACIIILWLGLVFLVVTRQPLTPMVVFTVVASGIIVFVPLWKKYVRNKRKPSDE